MEKYKELLESVGLSDIEGVTSENLVKTLVEKNPDSVKDILNAKSTEAAQKAKDEISSLLTNKLKKHLTTNFGIEDASDLEELTDFEKIISTVKSKLPSTDSRIKDMELSKRQLELDLQATQKAAQDLEKSMKAEFEGKLLDMNKVHTIKASLGSIKLSDTVNENMNENFNLLVTALDTKYSIKPSEDGKLYVYNKDNSIVYEDGTSNQLTLDKAVQLQVNKLGWVKSDLVVDPTTPRTASSSKSKRFAYPTRSR